jgi:hypothetical protein
MSDESFALSTVLPPIAPEGDYDAICATVMESARGRWFLQEYARRNRNADTLQVLAAIERIETVIRGERGRDAYASFRGELAEMAKTIAAARAEVADTKPPAAAGGGTAPAQAKAADILAAAERLQDVTWTMRERGLDPATCDQIEAITAAIQKASAPRDPDDGRARKLGEALQSLERRIHTMLETVTSAPAADEPTPEAAPLASVGAAVQGPGDDHAAGVIPKASSTPEEPAVEAHAVSAPAETGGLELEPLVVTLAALSIEDTQEPAHALEHAPLAVEPLLETRMTPVAERLDAAGARDEAVAEAADVTAAAPAETASGLPDAAAAAIEPAFPSDGTEAPVHAPPPDFTAVEPPPLPETMSAPSNDPAAASDAANCSNADIAIVERAQSIDEFAEEHALVVIEHGVPDEAVPVLLPEADFVVAAARETGAAADSKRRAPVTAREPPLAERAPADEQKRFDDWTKFARELHAAGIKTQIPEDEPAPSAPAQAASADALAPTVASEPAASAPANDEITELEAELFAPDTPTAVEPTTPPAPQPAPTPPAPAAASRAGAAPPPLAATPMPQPAPNDPLAALKALSDEERIALFT